MDRSTVTIEGRILELSNLDKALYPSGFRKADVIDYYRQMAPLLLPHLRDRPITLKRYPNGSQGPFFYQKRAPQGRPDWLRTAHIATKSDAIDFCIIEDVAGLVYLANLACLEIHVYLARAKAPSVPTMMVFDLDPGAPATVLDCCRVALLVHELLEGLGLTCLAKVSGSKGIHLCVPLNAPTTFAQTKDFAHAVARTLELQAPELVTSMMAKSGRTGKVFIDWSQNDAAKTTCCVYSLRAAANPLVSAPISWDAIRQAVKTQVATPLIMDAAQVLRGMSRRLDAFATLETKVQQLPRTSPGSAGASPGRPASARKGRAFGTRTSSRASQRPSGSHG
jgi:bifunctional non-homologous end joining protein LigD